MPKLTDDQIELTITQAHANVMAVVAITNEQRVVDRAAVRELRSVFLAGKDHGEACVIERAESLLGDQVADVQAAAAGRALGIVSAWVAARPGRFLGTVGAGYGSVFLADDEPLLPGGTRAHYFHLGTSMVETIAQLAAWCVEYDARDTEPAPPNLESSGAMLAAAVVESAETRAEADSALAIERELYGTADALETPAPTTARNL